MYNLNTYKQEIIAISAANGNVDIGVATDMFLSNIQDAGKEGDRYHYAGADHIDYAALRPHYKELAESKTVFLEEWGKELGYLNDR